MYQTQYRWAPGSIPGERSSLLSFFATSFDFKRVEEEREFLVSFCPFWKPTKMKKKTLVFLPFLEL